MLNKFVWWIAIRNFTHLSLSTCYLKINGCCKSIKVDPNITYIGFKPQWIDAHGNNFLTIQARELKFCVCYLREKSAPLTNFQPYWTPASKVRDLGHFICRVSSPIVGGGVNILSKFQHFYVWISKYDFIVCISQYTINSMDFTVCMRQYAFHSMYLTECILQYAFHSMHFTVSINQCAFNVMQFKVWILDYAF